MYCIIFYVFVVIKIFDNLTRERERERERERADQLFVDSLCFLFVVSNSFSSVLFL